MADVVIGMKVALADLVHQAAVTQSALGVEYALLAFAVGRRPSGGGAWPSAWRPASRVASYALFVLGQLLDGVRPWQGASSFAQALGHGPVGPTWSPGVLTMLTVAAVATIVGVVVFDRRDLRP